MIQSVRGRAENAVRKLKGEHGLTQATIAQRVVVADSTITRIIRDPAWPVSETLATKLERQVSVEEARRADKLGELMRLRIGQLRKTTETCNRGGVAVDARALAQLDHVFSSLLIAACVDSSSPVHALPFGIDAALADIRLHQRAPTRLYLVAVREPTATEADSEGSQGRKLIAHELQHIVDTLRSEPGAGVPVRRAKSAY